MRQYKQVNQGFTLIELITVIAILGILAAVAFPNYTDLTSNARTQALANISGAITSADKINKTTKAALNAGIAIGGGSNCQTAAAALLDGGIPNGYSVTPTTAFTGGIGTVHTCTLTYTATGNSTTFTVTSTQQQ